MQCLPIQTSYMQAVKKAVQHVLPEDPQPARLLDMASRLVCLRAARFELWNGTRNVKLL